MSYPASRIVLTTRRRRLALVCAALGLGATPAIAQQREFAVVPSVRLTETVTDNARLGQSSSGTEWITQLNPSVRVDAKSARIDGQMTLGMNSAMYANGTQPNTNQLLLNGNGKLTAWENHGFIDLFGSISRQPTYAFQPQGTGGVTGTSNLSEVKLFTVSPYLKGRFGSTGTVEARYSMSDMESNSTAVSRNLTDTWSLTASDPYALGRLGWDFNYRDSHTESTNRRDIDHTSARFGGTFAVDPQLMLRVIGGSETSNYTSADTTTKTIYGGGGDWRISPFTTFKGTVEHRFFGTGYDLSFEHRGPQLAVQASYSRDVSSLGQSLQGATSQFDRLMAHPALVASFPNPSVRAAFITQNYATLLSMFPGTTDLTNGFYLDRRLQLSVTFIGARNSLTFTGFRTERTPLTESSFSLSPTTSTTSNYTTIGGTATAQHKLTPITSANLSLTAMRSETGQATVSGTATGPVSARSRMITAGLTTNFTPKTTGSLSIRNSHGSGSTSYTENALYGTVLYQF